MTIDKAALRQKRDDLIADKAKIDATLSPTADMNLVSQKAACEGRIKALQDNLDVPNKRYQAYQETLKAWEQQKQLIEGDAETGHSEML